MAGRCHSEPGMEIRRTPIIRIPQLGDRPMTTNAMTFSTMQTVSIRPHWSRNRSTSTPDPMLIRPLPLVRIPNKKPVCRVLRARVLAMAVRNTGKTQVVQVSHAMPERQGSEDETPVLPVSARRLYCFRHCRLPDTLLNLMPALPANIPADSIPAQTAVQASGGGRQGNRVLISATQQVGAEELALPVCRGCFFVIPLISVHFRHYSVIPAIPSWPLIQSRPAGKSGGCCLLTVIYIEHMLYSGRKLGKGRMTAQ